jgi:WD40 repeat protein
MSYSRTSLGFRSQSRVTLPKLWIAQLEDYILSLSFSASGRELAVMTGSGKVFIIDTVSGTTKTSIDAHQFGGFGASFSKSGLLASHGQDGFIRIWNPAENFSLLKEEKMKNAWVERFAWNSQGTHFAASAGKELLVGNNRGEILWKSFDHPASITSIQWERSGETFLTASYGMIRFNTVLSAEPKETLFWKTSFISMAISPNSKFLAAGTQEQDIHFWILPYEPNSDLHMSGYPNKVTELAYDARSTTLASNCANSIMLWDITGSGPEGKMPVELNGHTGKVTAIRYQHRGNKMATGDQYGLVSVWNPKKNTEMTAAALLSKEISTLQWSPSDELLAAASIEGEIVLIKI